MHDSGPEPNRILIFATAQNLRMLARAKHIFADGTFKTTPQPLFEQLYSIHANLGDRVTPLVFSLLKRKDTETYERMLNIVKGLAAGMNPETITTDFEDASIAAFHTAFPNARLKRLLFSFWPVCVAADSARACSPQAVQIGHIFRCGCQVLGSTVICTAG